MIAIVKEMGMTQQVKQVHASAKAEPLAGREDALHCSVGRSMGCYKL